MTMFNDIIWGSEDNERQCSADATLVPLFAKDSQQDFGHSRTWIRKEVVF